MKQSAVDRAKRIQLLTYGAGVAVTAWGASYVAAAANEGDFIGWAGWASAVAMLFAVVATAAVLIGAAVLIVDW